MNASRISLALTAAVLTFAAPCGAQTATVQATSPPAADVVTLDGTVVDVDASGRRLTLRSADGTNTVMTVAPQVANLGAIKNGDHVVVKQTVPVAVSAARPGAVASSPGTVAATAPGARSSQARVDTEEVTATVQAVDPAAHMVTLRASDGTSRTVKLDPSVSLDQVAAGDQATLRITRATAIAVDNSPVR